MAKRQWLEKLIDEYISSVSGLPENDEGRAAVNHCAQWMHNEWAARGLTSYNQKRELLSAVRREVKRRLGSNHFALDAIESLPIQQQETDGSSEVPENVVESNVSQIVLSPRTVNSLVYRATNLINRNTWADVACGLSVLTGRRPLELMKTAGFESKSDFSIMFFASRSRAEHEGNGQSIEIPTLCRSDYVLSATTKLRAMALTDTLTTAQVNARYVDGVSYACNHHFADLLPLPSGRNKDYIHTIPGLYAAIAAYFYCPKLVQAQDYKAYILGRVHSSGFETLKHLQEGTDGFHYDKYVVGDSKKHPQYGIKLGQQGVDVIEIFQQPNIEKLLPKGDSRVKRSSIKVGDRQREIKNSPKDTTSQSSILEIHSTVTQKEVKMTEDNLSQFELITYSEAYERAVDRGFSGTKKDFRTKSTKQPDVIIKQFGVRRDHSIVKPAINQPTWRDLQSSVSPSKSSSPTKEIESVMKSSAATLPAGSGENLDFVRKLSTGIDFLAREVDSMRAERDAAIKLQSSLQAERDSAVKESDRLEQKLKQSQEPFNEVIAAKDQKIISLEDQIESLQAQVSELQATCEELEPILKLVGRAQAKRQDSSDELESSENAEAIVPKSSSKTNNGQNGKGTEKSSSTVIHNGQKKTGNKKSASNQSKAIPSKSKTTKSKASTSQKVKNTSSSKVNKSSSQKKTQKKRHANLDPSVSDALDAIMEYNNESGRTFEEKWAISYPVMKDLLTQVGSSTQTKIKAVFDARGKEIDAHMKKHGLGKRHNRNHQNESISDVLKLVAK